ncbi:MAG TPA: HlyD family efflux transporter periplasmic adaptor subunit, partial [Myxococcota bacterium]
ERMRSVLELVAAIHERDRYRDSATHLATELTAKLQCERVSIAALRAGRLHVTAMSNSADFGKHVNLVRAIENAMEESAEFGRGLAFPRDDGGAVPTFAHAELAREFGTSSICSVPFYRAGLLCGALCLERGSQRPFEADEQAVAEAVASLCGPALEALRREDRSWLAKSGAAMREQLQELIGPHHTAKKLSVAGALALLMFFAFATGEYRVTAKAELEAEFLRTAVAPFSSYLAEAFVRAGDRVRAGDLLARLDDRELRLEQRRLASELAQYERQGREALADRDAAQVRILAAEADQARAQLALIEHQLQQLEVRTPIDGSVVSGDLSQALGAPFERGDVFFEIAPLEDYRLVLKVDESDIRGLTTGITGSAILASSPDEPLPFEVVTITPVSSAEEGGNFFRVEGRLAETPPRLQPGMEGVGKIDLGRRNLVWIWTHKAIDWLRLAAWRWLP